MRLHFGGGLNEQVAPSIHEAASGSFNFELAKDSYQLRPRKPFDLAATVPNALQINGIMQLVTRAGVETTIIEAGAQIYRWTAPSTFSSMGTANTASQLRDTYWSLDDYIVITDLQKLTPVSRWNGTAFTTQTTGLGATTLYAKYSLVKDGRVWLFNVKTSTDTPHLMVASAFENPTSFDITTRAGAATISTGLEAFYMLTPDLRPINGVSITTAGEVILSTERGALFKLTGTSALDYAWKEFYPGSQAVGSELVVSTGNDILYMRKGGAVESLIATQNYGDVAVDDLSRWIRDTVRNLAAGIAIYDQSNQKVLFFVANKILVFFKDVFYGGAQTGPESDSDAKLSPWSVYTSQYMDAPLASINAAKYMRRPGTAEYTVYFGDSAGRIIDLNGAGVAGDVGSVDINLTRITKFMDARDKINTQSHVLRGAIEYKRVAEADVSLDFEWADEYTITTATARLLGPTSSSTAGYWGGASYFGGATYWSQAFVASRGISRQNFSAVGRGSGVTMSLSSVTGSQYQIESIELK